MDGWSAIAAAAELDSRTGDPGWREEADRQASLDIARRAIRDSAPVRAVTLAGRLSAGPERDEIERLARLLRRAQEGTGGEPVSDVEAWPPAAPFDAAAVDALSGWGLPRACLLLAGLPAPGCDAARRMAERLLEAWPEDPGLLRQLLAFAEEDGSLERAAALSLRAARAASFEPGAVDALLGRLASLAEIRRDGRPGVADETLRALANRLPLFGPPAPNRRRAFRPGWVAARAALANDPDAAATGWREAVALEPAQGRFHSALGAALERAGRGAEAAVERRRAAELAGLDPCAERVRTCSPELAAHDLAQADPGQDDGEDEEDE